MKSFEKLAAEIISGLAEGELSQVYLVKPSGKKIVVEGFFHDVFVRHTPQDGAIYSFSREMDDQKDIGKTVDILNRQRKHFKKNQIFNDKKLLPNDRKEVAEKANCEECGLHLEPQEMIWREFKNVWFLHCSIKCFESFKKIKHANR